MHLLYQQFQLKCCWVSERLLAETLSEEDKLAVVAYFQSFWSDEIYTDWLKRNPIKQ